MPSPFHKIVTSHFILLAVVAVAGLALSARANDGPVHGPSRPFEGTFSDEKLTVTLTADSSIPGEAYTGEFALKGVKYRASGDAKDGKLTGRFFDDKGNAFTFSAEISGTTLTLKTGSTTYTLKAKKKE